MSLSVIMEEPSGFQDGDLEFVGRVPHSANRRRPQTYGGTSSGEQQRYSPKKGRYTRGHSGRGLGGLRLSSQSYSPNAPGPGPTRGGTPRVMPIRFVRNPRHPKSMYDTEISMRNFIRGRPPKLTPDMSFPDPKVAGAFRNPVAPRFHHEYDVTEEFYDIRYNPLAGVDVGALFGGSAPRVNQGYDATGDDDSISDNDFSESDAQSILDDGGSVVDDSTFMDDSVSRRAGDGTAIYSTVQKYRTPPPPPPPVQLQQAPPSFDPQPPQEERFNTPVLVLPRAVFARVEERPALQEIEEVPPPLPTPLQTLAEEEEPQEIEVDEDDDDEDLQKRRNMSTQTTVTVQDVGEPSAQQDDGSEDRFVQIGEGRADTETIMTHENWEAVAPWSRQSVVSVPVTPDTSLAVNYRRVVAELSGTEGPTGSPSHQRQEGRRPELPPPRQEAQIDEEPPPWSPPIVPQREEILRPSRREEMEMEYLHRDQDQRRYRRFSMADCLNRCCLVLLLTIALFIIIGAVIVTILYATYYSNCTTSCGLVQQPAYLGAFVALGALAVLVVFALFTWCCYNVSRRQHIQKYRTRERH